MTHCSQPTEQAVGLMVFGHDDHMIMQVKTNLNHACTRMPSTTTHIMCRLAFLVIFFALPSVCAAPAGREGTGQCPVGGIQQPV